ncbi:hypothetical protein FO440_18435 [Mucilaginibacter corticis]|uniref:Uncharacterized protein n=1 Tax=Mucilaginibacter corticis TaxID=2597670 RepID=A0A556MIH7_9SPHI|nr:hypothetical protein [Mucilaginibacter corticis]TSJ39716.1 hypothetical protein FO440_18435 [Mucilaginibacter corticis]
MERPTKVDELLKNINNIHELGRQRAFELGNPFYAQYSGDGEYYTKEMPDGERFLVDIEVITNDHNIPVEIKDTIIKKLGRR